VGIIYINFRSQHGQDHRRLLDLCNIQLTWTADLDRLFLGWMVGGVSLSIASTGRADGR
jgi:hypothetical protein